MSKIPNIGESVEKSVLLYTLVENANCNGLAITEEIVEVAREIKNRAIT
jgi:hypothetical protein